MEVPTFIELINYGMERFAEKHRNDRSYFRKVTAAPGQLAVIGVDEFKRQKKNYKIKTVLYNY